MKAPANTARFEETNADGSGRVDLVLSPDGRVFAHNLTPALAAVLAELNPDDEAMRARAEGGEIKIKIRSMSMRGSRMPTSPSVNVEPRTANE